MSRPVATRHSRRALTTMTPAEVRDEITKSGLRGRGGAGYPAGLKWNTVAKATGSGKYVICNADEGDPGAFMDRTILESDPHRVLEGMAIAAYAVGASAGYVYCRGEYPLVVSRVRKAIRDATRGGYLGNTIMDTKFSFEVDVRLGAGAYVCGEETALIASIEGEPRHTCPAPPVSSRRRSVGPPDTHQQRRDPGQRRTHHPQRRRLVRLDRDRDQQGHEGLRSRRPGRQHRDSSKSRWARRCGRSCSTSAAGSWMAGPSRRSRPAARQVAASPPSSSTCRWITSRSSKSARSWAPAG